MDLWLLLVGHEPLLGQILGHYVAGDPGREIPLKKGSIAGVAIEERGKSGRLLAFLPARVLERLGGGGRGRRVL